MNATIQTVIRRPVEDVAAFVMDPANDLRWIGGLTHVRRLDDGPIREGSQVERIAVFMGRKVRYVMQVVDFRPPTRLAMHAVESPFPMDVTYSFAPHPEGSTARIDVAGGGTGLLALAGPLQKRMVVRNITKDLERLKQALET